MTENWGDDPAPLEDQDDEYNFEHEYPEEVKKKKKIG
jgi:hypothetical protein